MRYILILIAFLFYLQDAEGQIRLKYSKSQIKNEFSDEKYKLDETVTNDFNGVSIFNERVNLLYLFNTNEVCFACILIPHTDKILNDYIQFYNDNYVTISDKEWKMYSKNTVASIELVYTEKRPALRWLLKE